MFVFVFVLRASRRCGVALTDSYAVRSMHILEYHSGIPQRRHCRVAEIGEGRTKEGETGEAIHVRARTTTVCILTYCSLLVDLL